MRVYMYQAALYCEQCGKAIRSRLLESPDCVIKTIADERGCSLACAMEYESYYDSDKYPKGPYNNGGGESDTPQHCDACHAFLENPLTPDGVEYVREALEPYIGESESWQDVAHNLECDAARTREEKEIPGLHVTRAATCRWTLAQWARFYEAALGAVCAPASLICKRG